MGTLYVTEYAALSGNDNGGVAQIAKAPGVAGQTVTISGSHAESAAFNDATRFIRVHTDAICSIAISAAPVATTTMKRMAADQTEYFGVTRGHKISVISNT